MWKNCVTDTIHHSNIRTTESQYIEVGRELWRFSGPIPLLKQGRQSGHRHLKIRWKSYIK